MLVPTDWGKYSREVYSRQDGVAMVAMTLGDTCYLSGDQHATNGSLIRTSQGDQMATLLLHYFIII